VILVDTSVWVDHLRKGDAALARLLDSGMVLAHPFVIGELALGNLRQHDFILTALQDLPRAVVATEQEVLQFIAQHTLAGAGISYVDAHLLAAVRLTAGATLWTRDKRLLGVAQRLDPAASQPPAKFTQS
jgi:predicted nucleic acid-binding protein